MAQTFAEKFIKEGTVKSFDEGHRHIIDQNLGHYQAAFEQGVHKFFDLANSKKKAHLIKWKAMENLDRYLLDFEANFTKRGGHVIWANDAAEACAEIARILDAQEVKAIVKAHSMISDEIALDSLLKERSIAATETDFSRFVTQLSQQKPSHFGNPVADWSFSDIKNLFHEQFDTPLDATAGQLTAKMREIMREKHVEAEAAITGVDFLLADIGGISISENEGNARLASTFPKVHIALAGIDQIIPGLQDVDLLWPLLSSHGSGQQLRTYNSILSGPCQARETDGPEEMYVILIDNGRSNLLAKKDQRQALYCIHCAACLNVCPIYRNVGGDAYHSTYQGPIGSVAMPHLESMKAFSHLNYASPLSAKPTEICPMSIDLRKLTLLNRKETVEQQLVSSSEKRAWKFFTSATLNRRLLDFFAGKTKNFLAKIFFKKHWGTAREIPKFADKSFSKLWREQEKNRKD